MLARLMARPALIRALRRRQFFTPQTATRPRDDKIEEQGKGLRHHQGGEGGAQKGHPHPGFQAQEHGGEDGGQPQGQEIDQVEAHQRQVPGQVVTQDQEKLIQSGRW